MKKEILRGLLLAWMLVVSTQVHADDNCVKTTCQEIIWFNNAAHDTSIGYLSTCPGTKGRQGKSSRWREVDVQTVTVCGEDGRLPCRIDPSRCMAIPDPNKPLPLDTEQDPKGKP